MKYNILDLRDCADMDHEDAVAHLRKIGILGEASPEQLHRLATLATWRRTRAGEEIISHLSADATCSSFARAHLGFASSRCQDEDLKSGFCVRANISAILLYWRTPHARFRSAPPATVYSLLVPMTLSSSCCEKMALWRWRSRAFWRVSQCR